MPSLDVKVKTDKFAWPTKGPLYAFFSSTSHKGIDIYAWLGTPIVAAENGIVVGKFEFDWGYGKHVLVYHGQGFITLYAHLYEFNAGIGDRVQKGEMIGLVGSTGFTTGPHLHFEVRYFGKTVNPLDYLPGAASSKGINPPPPENPKATPTPEPKVTPTPVSKPRP